MKKVISTEKKPIKLWLDDIEDGALDQAKNLANLPFVFKHIAIMPDSHQGYGMPIGGVMATKGVIIPNAVGVDIGCFDKDTEFLSPTGWKKISEYNGELVGQFEPRSGEVDFVKPVRYIKEKCDKFIKIKTKYGIDQLLSEDHRCLVWEQGNDYFGSGYDVILAKDLMNKHNLLKLGYRKKICCSFLINRKSNIKVDYWKLRVIVMFSADGSFNGKKCILQFKKERKIKRAEELLRYAKIKYNKTIHKNGVVRISFNSNIKKGLEQFWGADREQLAIIADECLYWDGDQKNCFYTSRKEEADFIHYAFGSIGNRSVMRLDRVNEYRVFKYKNCFVGIAGTPKSKIKYVKSEDGYKYSFTVPTSFLIMRRGGNIFATGNCGMCAVKTSLTEIDTETLKKIMGEIRNVVPVGFNKHTEKQDRRYLPNIDMSDPNNYSNCYQEKLPYICNKEFNNALKSLGTLGGGNHFIEIQKGSDNHIWIMIHSGSRNLGKQVADHYNKIAIELNEKYFSEVKKDKELAFLLVDSEEGQAYIREMNYCVDFALANRKLMMGRIIDIFSDIIIKDGVSDRFSLEQDLINIAHNYTKQENHFGENVWVHRKGATLASKNTIGIIPGSQGTKSYIVLGRNNPDSFNSCSHGAGRVMGRKQAERDLNLEEEIKRLNDKGVLHSIRDKKDLDEAPSAYKDIDIVIKNQEDLVDVLVELTPLGVIKG